MKVNVTKTLNELLADFNISKELLAAKFGVTTMTIYRWSKGETRPSFAEMKFLERIYNGYKSKKGGAK